MISSLLDSALITNNIDDKFRFAKLYANLIDQELIYDAIGFEEKIIQQILPLVSQKKIILSSTLSEVCHVLSAPYNIGGHTRLCERLAEMDTIQPDLLITHYYTETTLSRLLPIFKEVNTTILYRDNLQKITAIIERLSQYEKIVLHIHPDDLQTPVAVGILKILKPNIKVYFVNHADHRFSFGKSITDIMLQISFRGYEVDKSIKSRCYMSSFLGIPIDIKRKPEFKGVIQNIVVAGSSYKMKPNKNISLQEEIAHYFLINKAAKIIVVGCNYTDYWWWSLKLKFFSRVRLYNLLPYNKYMDLIKNSDTCIDTTPITGGTAFVEMYVNGLLPIGFKCGIYGYSPLDVVRINKISELCDYSENFTDTLFSNIEKVHGFNHVKHRYNSALNFSYSDIPPCLTNKENDMKLFLRLNKADLTFELLKLIYLIQTLSLSNKLNLIKNQFKLSGLILVLLNEFNLRIVNISKKMFLKLNLYISNVKKLTKRML